MIFAREAPARSPLVTFYRVFAGKDRSALSDDRRPPQSGAGRQDLDIGLVFTPGDDGGARCGRVHTFTSVPALVRLPIGPVRTAVSWTCSASEPAAPAEGRGPPAASLRSSAPGASAGRGGEADGCRRPTPAVVATHPAAGDGGRPTADDRRPHEKCGEHRRVGPEGSERTACTAVPTAPGRSRPPTGRAAARPAPPPATGPVRGRGGPRTHPPTDKDAPRWDTSKPRTSSTACPTGGCCSTTCRSGSARGRWRPWPARTAPARRPCCACCPAS